MGAATVKRRFGRVRVRLEDGGRCVLNIPAPWTGPLGHPMLLLSMVPIGLALALSVALGAPLAILGCLAILAALYGVMYFWSASFYGREELIFERDEIIFLRHFGHAIQEVTYRYSPQFRFRYMRDTSLPDGYFFLIGPPPVPRLWYPWAGQYSQAHWDWQVRFFNVRVKPLGERWIEGDRGDKKITFAWEIRRKDAEALLRYLESEGVIAPGAAAPSHDTFK